MLTFKGSYEDNYDDDDDFDMTEITHQPKKHHKSIIDKMGSGVDKVMLSKHGRSINKQFTVFNSVDQNEISSIVNHDIRLKTDLKHNKTKEMAL